MSSETYLDNPHYVAHVELLKDLHLLMAQGKSETDEADALRDAMEPHWYGLSEAEMERVRWLSEDLYAIEGQEMLTKVPANQRTREWLAPAFEAARVAQDWDIILDLLRTGPDYMSLGTVAQLRAWVYSALGLPHIALLFSKYAMKQEPKNAVYVLFALTLLFRLGRIQELNAKANQLLSQKNVPAAYQIDVGIIMFVAADQLPDQERPYILRRVIQTIRRALVTDTRAKQRDLLDHFGGDVYFVLGACYLKLNDEAAAIRAFKECLKINPADKDISYILNKLTTSNDTQEIGKALNDRAMLLTAALPMNFLPIAA